MEASHKDYAVDLNEVAASVVAADLEGESHDLPAGRHVFRASPSLDLEDLVSQVQESARARDDVLKMQGDVVRRLKSRARRALSATLPQEDDQKARDKKIRDGAKVLVKELLAGKTSDSLAAASLEIYARDLLLIHATLSDAVKSWTKALEELVKRLPVWEAWGEGIRGLGPAGLGTLILYTGDPTRYRPEGLRRRMGGAVFGGKAERLTRGEKSGFIPRAKSALFVLVDSQIKSRGPYREFYDFRKRLEEEKIPDSSAMHRHLRAMRWCMWKMLADFREAWEASS